jgi:hypothetical protein
MKLFILPMDDALSASLHTKNQQPGAQASDDWRITLTFTDPTHGTWQLICNAITSIKHTNFTFYIKGVN